MTNDTPLWYMDGDYLCYRNRPTDKRFVEFVMVRAANNARVDDLLIDAVLKSQPTLTDIQNKLLHNHGHSSADNAVILRLILAEQSQAAEANTASLGAQLAQVMANFRDLAKKHEQQTIELDDHRSLAQSLDEHKTRLSNENFILGRQLDASKELNTRLTTALETSMAFGNKTHDELQAVTESLNEKTLALNNMRQFYRDRDAELDRMREYVRQVTQERTTLQQDYKRLDDAFVKLHERYTQLATTVQYAERMRVSALELSMYTLDNSEQK